MRLAEIVEVGAAHLAIPQSFQKPLGLHEGSAVFVYRSCKRKPTNLLLTTIPDRCWERLLRVSCLLTHEPGALTAICQAICGSLGNILIMEGYGRDIDGEGWWSGIVDFPPQSRGPANLGDAKERLLNELKKLYDTYDPPKHDPRNNPERDSRATAEETSVSGGAVDCWPFSRAFLRWTDGRHWAVPVEIDDTGLVLVHPESAASDQLPGEDRPVLVEEMRLSKIYRQLKLPPNPMYELWSEVKLEKFRDGLGIRLRKGTLQLEGPHHGLLLCNTEERFLRFVESEALVKIDVRVKTEGLEERIGVDVLRTLTNILRQEKINILYTYNYILQRPRSAEADVEESQVRFFADHRDPGQISLVSLETKWFAVFGRLARAIREDDDETFVEEARFSIWHKGQRLRYWADKEGEIHRKWQWMYRLRTGLPRPPLPRWSWSYIAIMFLASLVAFDFGWEMAGVMFLGVALGLLAPPRVRIGNK